MGITKSEIYTDKQNRLATMLKALAHPARIAIIQHLVKSDECICSDLVEELGLAQATISQHLKELKSIGIIKGRARGFAGIRTAAPDALAPAVVGACMSPTRCRPRRRGAHGPRRRTSLGSSRPWRVRVHQPRSSNQVFGGA